MNVQEAIRHAVSRRSRWIPAAAAVLTVAAASPAFAKDHINLTTGMTLAGAPLAIHGYDPVAFFTDGQARVGKAAFTAKHDGAAYRFVSEANKAAFEKDPGRYLPQYGGFCPQPGHPGDLDEGCSRQHRQGRQELDADSRQVTGRADLRSRRPRGPGACLRPATSFCSAPPELRFRPQPARP